MSDPPKPDLEYLYANKSTNETTVKVFANGKMQVVAYVAVSYDDTLTEAKAIDYVQKNCVIWSLDDDEPVSWEKSFESNEYLHDIEDWSATGQSSSPSDPTPTKANQLRVPIYFTVPRAAIDQYKWIAKMDSTSTSKDQCMEVHGTQFSAKPEHFIFEDMDSYDQGHAHLRRLRYKSGAFGGNSPLKLVKLVENMGVHFEGNAWMIFVRSTNSHKSAFFFEYGTKTASIAAQNGHHYNRGDYTVQGLDDLYPVLSEQGMMTSGKDSPWDDCEGMDLTEAWTLGIPIVRIDQKHLWVEYGYHPEKFNLKGHGIKVEDNFGNQMSLDINWDSPEDWYTYWAVSNVVLLNA